MDDQVTRLVDKAWGKLQQLPDDRRLLIAIAGIPGSGKTTLSKAVTAALNARHAAQNPGPAGSAAAAAAAPIAVFVPMDGFHLTRAQLSAMPDPARAHARRGAEFTFDGAAFLGLVRALRGPATATVYAPSFDHAVKDPRPDDIAILPAHRAVVLEGNYVCLDREPWRAAAALADERWFVAVDAAAARRRLVARHVRAGIAPDAAAAARRADENDLVNAQQILAERLDVDELVVSREDAAWVHD
ncbi:phosphoribulokinase/uridine kinase [Durotheca rogersii]|uniref:phosphoribulokinase/uridine kinase n=1 Tax=Durotheca rogersii TaxID=419775 RepID=UPI00221F839B|nr:phosphoribulokinase/uridine kinase [Durotheca rogersii]KAI5860282.1 phosphoribulokinase/uridine kinase [Durotheca rogersii]